MNWKGTLKREFFGGEVWVLQTKDGAQYQLKGSIPHEMEGKRVLVDGKISPDAMSFSMVGDIIDVSRVRRDI